MTKQSRRCLVRTVMAHQHLCPQRARRWPGCRQLPWVPSSANKRRRDHSHWHVKAEDGSGREAVSHEDGVMELMIGQWDEALHLTVGVQRYHKSASFCLQRPLEGKSVHKNGWGVMGIS